MYKVVILSQFRNYSIDFPKRYRLRIIRGKYSNASTAYREFSSLSKAQDFALSLLGHISPDLCVYLANDKHDVLCIFQEGW